MRACDLTHVCCRRTTHGRHAHVVCLLHTCPHTQDLSGYYTRATCAAQHLVWVFLRVVHSCVCTLVFATAHHACLHTRHAVFAHYTDVCVGHGRECACPLYVRVTLYTRLYTACARDLCCVLFVLMLTRGRGLRRCLLQRLAGDSIREPTARLGQGTASGSRLLSGGRTATHALLLVPSLCDCKRLSPRWI